MPQRPADAKPPMTVGIAPRHRDQLEMVLRSSPELWRAVDGVDKRARACQVALRRVINLAVALIGAVPDQRLAKRNADELEGMLRELEDCLDAFGGF